MNKFKLFIENFLVYGLGGIVSKIIPLVMVPIITRLMPNSAYYGISDMSNTLVSFACAVAVMGMYDAMYRMFFENDNEDYKREICSTAFLFTVITSCIVLIIMLIFKEKVAEIFFGDDAYAYLVYIIAIATFVGATNSIVSAPTRMQNKGKIFLVTNTVSPILSYAVSVPLLLKGYYIIALPLAGMISAFVIEVTFGVLNAQWFQLKYFRIYHLRTLLGIAIPLFPNFIVYWIFNSSDRMMITNMLGMEYTGIYSIGAKLGLASQLIYTAFAGGWQFFAFSTMKEEGQVELNSKIYEYLGVISFGATCFICSLSNWIYNILFIGNYTIGYIIAPYLFLAPLLQMLFQVACNQFIIIKKTWPNMFILFLGAIGNVILNLVLIPVIGIEGAAIATLAGYILSNLICVATLCKMNLMAISRKFLISICVMILFFLIWRLYFIKDTIRGIVLALLVSGIFGYLYKQDLKILLKKTREK